MCTAVSVNLDGHIFGRTLDVPRGYGESVAVVPRGMPLNFIYEGGVREHAAFVGMAHIFGGAPLFYDGVNERGVAIAALRFPTYASYKRPDSGRKNLASFEVIPYVLALAESVAEAAELLEEVVITDDSYSVGLPSTPLHYIIADKRGAITLEPLEAGVRITDNPIGVLTNAPPFDYQLTRLGEYTELVPRGRERGFPRSFEATPPSDGYGAYGLPGDFSSTSRFVRAAYARENITATGCDVTDFYHLMSTVEVPLGVSVNKAGEAVSSVYTSAMDTGGGVYYYKTYGNPNIRAVRLSGDVIDGSSPIFYPIDEGMKIEYK